VTTAILTVCMLAASLLIGRLGVQAIYFDHTEGQLRAVSNVLCLLRDPVVHVGPEHHIIAPVPELVALWSAALKVLLLHSRTRVESKEYPRRGGTTNSDSSFDAVGDTPF